MANLPEMIIPQEHSLTAIIGTFKRGPVEEPTKVSSLNEFNKIFDTDKQIELFFMNGGEEALVVRLNQEGTSAFGLIYSGDQPIFKIEARNAGSWGNDIKLIFFQAVKGKYRLEIVDEVYPIIDFNIDSPFYFVTTINEKSNYIKVSTLQTPPSDFMPPQNLQLSGGTEGEKTLSKEMVIGKRDLKTGLYSLEKSSSHFNLLIAPELAIKLPNEDLLSIQKEFLLYAKEKIAFAILDAPLNTTPPGVAENNILIWRTNFSNQLELERFGAIYYPNLIVNNRESSASPVIAGIFTKSANQTGVWKPPSGLAYPLTGFDNFKYALTSADTNEMSDRGINGLREFFDRKKIIWGARTLAGDSQYNDDYRYVSTRRFVNFLVLSIETTLRDLSQETNNTSLRTQVKLIIEVFFQKLFNQGAFPGQTPGQSYFVKCDESNNSESDIEKRILNILIGVAPIKPNEFISIPIQINMDKVLPIYKR
jgi:hypothetical protein